MSLPHYLAHLVSKAILYKCEQIGQLQIIALKKMFQQGLSVSSVLSSKVLSQSLWYSALV